MNVGVPREIKPGEQRVALTPAGALALIDAGHSVVVGRAAGTGSGIADSDYAGVGVKVGSADDAWGAELVLKVKEPIAEEYRRLRPELILFTYLHLAADRDLAEALEA